MMTPPAVCPTSAGLLHTAPSARLTSGSRARRDAPDALIACHSAPRRAIARGRMATGNARHNQAGSARRVSARSPASVRGGLGRGGAAGPELNRALLLPAAREHLSVFESSGTRSASTSGPAEQSPSRTTLASRSAASCAGRGRGSPRSLRGFVLRCSTRSRGRCRGLRARLVPRRTRCCAQGAATRPGR